MTNTNKRELMKIINRLAAEERLNHLLAEIQGRAREPSDDLINSTSERVRTAIREFDAKETVAAISAGSGSVRSFVVERLSDWIAALPRLELGNLQLGNLAEGHADTRTKGAGGKKKVSVHLCTWKQDVLQLTLSCLQKPPYKVTLRVNEGARDAELAKLCWIDEASLDHAPGAPVQVVDFPMKRIDERTYLVDMDVDDFVGRLGSLHAAKELAQQSGADPRLLLPFVK